jgi:predicted ATPase/class 3 adenylate cyclase
MFCDLVGSTALSRRIDPEDLAEVLRFFRDACSKCVLNYGGYISRFMGDGMLALFGYPAADEDDAERATHAALAITEAVPAIRVPGQEPLRLSVRVGLATGVVVAGDVIGDGPSQEEAIFGETPNLAARLQTIAAPNTVIISDTTKRLLRDSFNYRLLSGHQPKGFDEAIEAWEVLGASDAETRFEAAHTQHVIGLVDRLDELGLMLRLWQEAKTSKSRVLLMGGEAGVGKSRLARALAERIASEPNNTLQLQCLPHYRYTALYPMMRYLERTAGIGPADSVKTKREKLRVHAGDQALPAYYRLLSIGDPETVAGDNVVEFSPKRQRELTFQTALRRLRELSRDKPTLVIIEDLHWMDPTSIELLSFVIDNIGEDRVLFLLTFRPEFKPDWSNKPNAETLMLAPLDSASGEVLARTVLGEQSTSPHVISQIVARTEGIPLFIEELAKSVAETGSFDGKPTRRAATAPRAMRAIPISLMDSLMARIDRLGEAKAIAQIGAVIGPEFAHALLERIVLADEPDLDPALARLVGSGLLLRQVSAGEIRYNFKHALVRDAAYNSLLRRRRETLHARIAACLEDHFPDDAANKPELLAEHYSEAGLAERAIRYWQRAGERASARSENLEAENHFKNGLRLLDSLQDSVIKKERELALLIGLGPVEIAIGGPGSKGANDVYERAVDLCSALPNSPLHFAAHWGQWRTSRTYVIKHRRADKLSAVTSLLGDDGLNLQAHHCQWAVLFNLGIHDRCCDHVEQGIRLYEAGDYRSHAMIYGGHDPAVCGHGQAALSLWLLGYPEQASESMARAHAVADDMGHAGSLLHALEIGLMFQRFRQDVDQVEALAERMIALSQKEEFSALEVKGGLFRAWAKGRRSGAVQAIDDLSAGIEKLRAIDASEDLPFFLDMLAECCLLAGRANEGMAALEAAFGDVEKTASRFWAAELHRHQGEIALFAGTKNAEERASKAFESALATAREQKARALELRAALSLARLLIKQEDANKARALLTPVYDSFTEGQDTPDLDAAKLCLQELGSGAMSG